jgi:hypothetical protein
MLLRRFIHFKVLEKYFLRIIVVTLSTVFLENGQYPLQTVLSGQFSGCYQSYANFPSISRRVENFDKFAGRLQITSCHWPEAVVKGIVSPDILTPFWYGTID